MNIFQSYIITKICFYSINNYFNKERITFFDNKKEELLSVLNLKKDESIENKINEIKNIFSIEDFSKNSLFQITEETKNKILEINNEDFLNEFKNMEDNILFHYLESHFFTKKPQNPESRILR